jgi:exosortase/archaeosortase family protein
MKGCFERMPSQNNPLFAFMDVATSFQQDRPSPSMAHATSARPEGDMSWKEVGELGLRYGRIPLALLLVEAFYWFLTLPSDTLAPLQVTEAWIWNEVTNLLYGEGSAVLSHHNGWLTRIDLQHTAFPGPFDSVGLYVSDECAGVHEMIFLSTLIMMTDGVPQKDKRRAVLVMCALVYLLNIVRLVVFYPIAVDSCLETPDVQACLTPMWQFHETVYTWGFLVVLVGMWLAWFVKFGGPTRTLAASKDDPSPWRFQRRTRFSQRHWALLVTAGVLFILAISHVSTNAEAMDARDTLAFCEFSSELSSTCSDAQLRWDDAIGYAWSLSALGIGLVVGAFVVIERPLEDGTWPKKHEPDDEVEGSPVVKGHHVKRSGSWRRRHAEEE